MPANGEERKIELIGTSGTPSPTVKPKKIPADRDVEDAVPYGKIEKISANRDVEDAVPYGKTVKNTGRSGRRGRRPLR